ncbi:MAG: hypothetical protein QG568_774 [Patescibacteria group bacterium]|nr:hypothetical protein [Patescibacteria group bacterium]
MDPNLKRNFSYPNSDQYNSQTNSDITPEGTTEEKAFQPRKTVNIIEALANSRKDNDDAQTVRTYQSDIANTIKNDNVSMIKIALSEKKRQEKRSQFDSTIEGNQKNVYILAGVIIAFIVIAGLIAGYIYLQSTNTTSGPSQTQQKVQPLLYTESTSVLNIDQINIDDLLKIIERDKEAVMELGDMKSIVLTVGSSTEERQLTSEEFFYLLKSRAPDGLIRALDANFLLGVYAFTPREMFAVFKVNSYDTAFAGMFEWEPNIESDIGDIFINKKERIGRSIGVLSSTKDTQQDTTGATTTQSSPFGVFSQRKFVDKVLSNKDARVLVDVDNREAMLYTFLDKETLVIATSEKSLKEIIFRLTTGRIVR